LSDKADGTFLWVGLACSELKLVDSKEAVKTLQALPKGLHLLYDKLLHTALNSKTEEDQATIKRILSSVMVALRPLSLSELSVVCQIHQGEDEEDRIQFTREEIESCRLLITIQDETVLQLHQSVKDFLVWSGPDCFINDCEAHADIAHRCVDEIIQSFYTETKQNNVALNGDLSSYSIQFWAHHAHMAGPKF
ncbi:uncharacterized protein BDZ99DRAFT_387998, partial [Mytilinidion resinicola]